MPKKCPQPVEDLITHLESTGTGKSKLEAIRKLGVDCEDAAEFEKRLPGIVPEGTLAKAKEFIDNVKAVPKRSVLDDDEPFEDLKSSVPGEEGKGKEDPVLKMNVDQAIDEISRMRSVERLQGILSTDERVTVKHAVEKRIEALKS